MNERKQRRIDVGYWDVHIQFIWCPLVIISIVFLFIKKEEKKKNEKRSEYVEMFIFAETDIYRNFR